MPLTGEKWILLGASRGLGYQFAKRSLQSGLCQSLVVASRKIEKSEFPKSNVPIEKWVCDFADPSQWESYAQKIIESQASRIFYFAGGGPYGNFATKAWKDHQWAFRLNFEFPAFVLHQILKQKNTCQLVFIGSAIADNSPDPGAASYSASKHALRGLISSVQAEETAIDLRLYSPGYMDTDLLPPDAWPRQQAGKVLPTDKVVDDLWQWSMNQHDANTQRIFTDKSLLK